MWSKLWDIVERVLEWDRINLSSHLGDLGANIWFLWTSKKSKFHHLRNKQGDLDELPDLVLSFQFLHWQMPALILRSISFNFPSIFSSAYDCQTLGKS